MSGAIRALSVACILSGAALTGGLGSMYLLDPDSVRQAAELVPQSASALSEVRSTYGGLHIGIALFLLVCAVSRDLRRAGLLFCGLAFACAGAARAAGILEFRPIGGGQAVTAVLEVVFSAISLWLWRALPAAQHLSGPRLSTGNDVP